MSQANERQVDGSHYKDMTIEPWVLMEAVLSPEEFRGYLKGNILKYSLRQGKKEGANFDGQKALHYLEKLNESEW